MTDSLEKSMVTNHEPTLLTTTTGAHKKIIKLIFKVFKVWMLVVSHHSDNLTITLLCNQQSKEYLNGCRSRNFELALKFQTYFLLRFSNVSNDWLKK